MGTLLHTNRNQSMFMYSDRGVGGQHVLLTPRVTGTTLIKYGLLYNFFVTTDSRELTSSSEWRVPTETDWDTLFNSLDSFEAPAWPTLGAKLRSVGNTYWVDQLIYDEGTEDEFIDLGIPGTDEYSFNIRGAGVRSFLDGQFYGKNEYTQLMSTSIDTHTGVSPLDHHYEVFTSFNLPSMTRSNFYNYGGTSIRLIKDFTSLSDGETGQYIGNDGKIYDTICIGTQEWVSRNLAETKYRNGDSIPEITNDIEWLATSEGALCAYNNDWNFV